MREALLILAMLLIALVLLADCSAARADSAPRLIYSHSESGFEFQAYEGACARGPMALAAQGRVIFVIKADEDLPKGCSKRTHHATSRAIAGVRRAVPLGLHNAIPELEPTRLQLKGR